MTLQRLEVYVDSYRNKPFVKDFDEAVDLTASDERQLIDWIELASGRRIDLHRNLRIEDVKHHFLDSMGKFVQGISVRVSIVD